MVLGMSGISQFDITKPILTLADTTKICHWAHGHAVIGISKIRAFDMDHRIGFAFGKSLSPTELEDKSKILERLALKLATEKPIIFTWRTFIRVCNPQQQDAQLKHLKVMGVFYDASVLK